MQAFDTPLDGFAIDARVAPQFAREAEVEGMRLGERFDFAITQPGFEIPDEFRAEWQETVQFQNLTGWRSPGEFLTTYEPRIDYVVRATRLATEFLDAVQDVEGPVELASLPSLTGAIGGYRFDRSPGNVHFTLNVYDEAGSPLEGLDVRYMSKGSRDLGCGREYGRRFSKGSYNASETLPRARFVLWVHDARAGRWSRPFEHDLQRQPDILTLDHWVDWDDE